MIARKMLRSHLDGDVDRLTEDPEQGANPCLERLISQETVTEILGAMTAAQLAVALLRCDGLSDVEIAARLGIGAVAVAERMECARRRILARVPELASFLSDDRQRRTARSPQSPTASEPEPEERVGLTELAGDLGLTVEAIRLRVLAGFYPGATQDDRGRWHVPRPDPDPTC